MKKSIHNVFTKSDKIICRLSGLFLCLILSLNLSAQKLQTLQTETWTAGNWVKASLQTLTYDGSNYLINALTQTWSGSAWVNSLQSNYTNNPTDGTANVVVAQSWNGSSWDNVSQTTYTYNGAKKVVTATSQIWAVSIWINSTLQTNTYNGSGFLINTLNQSWGGVSYQNSTQSNYTVNTDGNPTVAVDQSWNGSTWDNVSRSTYTYTTSKKIATDVTEHWTAGNWTPYSQETYTYDGSSFLTNSLSQLWNTGSSTYINDSQSNYTNNTNGTPSVVVYQSWVASAWTNANRLTFTYFPPTRVPELKSEKGITIYPNPAGDQIAIKGNLSIQGSAYSITDQSGKLVLKGKLINENGTIDISKLANGIYFLRIGEKGQNSFKVIKNK